MLCIYTKAEIEYIQSIAFRITHDDGEKESLLL